MSWTGVRSQIAADLKLKISLFVLPAEMLPKIPRSTWSKADDIKRHTDQQNNICQRIVHQIIIVDLNFAAFSIHQLFTAH